MFVDLNNLDHEVWLEADVCIAGAGPAGITLAKRLSGKGIRTILLESGGFEVNLATQELYRGIVVTGLPALPIHLSRLRYFGGTSNHWGGSCTPLTALDFKQRSWIPMSGWPIPRESLDPFYEEAHKLMHLGPYDYRLSTWRNKETPLWSFADGEVEHRVWQSARQDRQSTTFNFGRQFRKDLETEVNCTVVLHANLSVINTTEGGATVTTVLIRSLEGKVASVQARFFVLACSGIENPRILLTSKTEAGYAVGNQNDNVGRYYMFHPAINCGEILLAKNSTISSDDANVEFALSQHGLFRYVFVLSDKMQESGRFPHYAILLDIFQRNSDSGFLSLKRLYHRFTRKRSFDGIGRDILNVVSDLDDAWLGFRDLQKVSKLRMELRCESEPNRDNRVLLSNERDALGMPRAQVDWNLLPDEPAVIRRFCELMARQFIVSGIGRVKLVENLDDAATIHRLLKERAEGTHHRGTTRMSTAPKDGVVDENCRVHGMSNLYCAGSSVFPTAGYATPTITIVALALRLADHLREHFG